MQNWSSFDMRLPPRRKVWSQIMQWGSHRYKVSLGLNRGKTNKSQAIEDRAIIQKRRDGSVVMAVFDGVGECWHGDATLRPQYMVGGRSRVLGDIPGYCLSSEMIRSYKGLTDSIFSASQSYQDFLRGVGLHPQRKKHQIGGCTFAAVRFTEKGNLEVATAGDARLLLRGTFPGGGFISSNDLASLNEEFERAKASYLLHYGAIDGRRRFNSHYKPEQRNALANVKYSFFDGDKRCLDIMYKNSFSLAEIDEFFLLTDGAYECCADDDAFVQMRIETVMRERGVLGLLSDDDQPTSSEATVVHVKRLEQ